jgi:peptide/nickel transport system permease protein
MKHGVIASIYEFVQSVKESYFLVYMRSNPLHAFGIIYMIISVILALVGPMIVPHSPVLSSFGEHLLPPSEKYWFGTDANGMCIFSRCIAAFRTDLLIALAGAFLSMVIGAPIGVFAGYFDGKGGVSGFLSMLVLRVEDVLQAFPIFVLGLVLLAAFGPHPMNLIVAIFAINHIANLRLARSEVLSLRDKAFVEAARASGNSDLRIAFFHLMPNAMTPVIALLSVVTGFGILLTAGLSFVGAGVEPPTPEWGSMISIGGPSMITGQWWPSFFPGVIMAISIFAFSMVGEAITALLDPLERIRLGFGR